MRRPRLTPPASVLGLGSRLLGSLATTEPPPPDLDDLRPHVGSRRWGWTHYGVMVPDLPAPHRFLALMSLLGTTGSAAFDTDHARPGGPRGTATLVCGTAVTPPLAAFTAYRIADEVDAAADGTRVRFGDDVELGRDGTRVTARGQRAGVDFDLALDLELGHTTWFLRSRAWQHVSIPARYTGTVGGTTVAGRATFEHARSAVTPHLLGGLPLPPSLKVPFTGFHYHVVDVGAGQQLLLGHNEANGVPALTAAYLRTPGGPRPRRWVRDVRFTVDEHQAEPAVAPDGRTMRLPRRFTWTVPGVLELHGEVDTPMLYGLGSGYVGGYAHHGTIEGRAVGGRGYLEFIDRRPG